MASAVFDTFSKDVAFCAKLHTMFTKSVVIML